MCFITALYWQSATPRASRNFCDRLEGDDQIKEVIIVDQSPVGRTPRSNPATYMKAFDAIRDVFFSENARCQAARILGRAFFV